MNDHNLIDFLLEHGGPAVRLRLAADLAQDLPVEAREQAAAGLLAVEEVQRLLAFLDPFRALDGPTVERRYAHDLIHCYRETSLENFFPRLLELGFRAGIPLFDEKMQFLRAAFPKIRRVEPLYGWVICAFFFKAGYECPEMVDWMRQRLDALQPAAREQIVDIYFKEDALQGLPTQWKGKRIIQHELSPYTGAKPLPTVHDLAACAYFPRSCLDEATRQKIDRLVAYVLLPDFQTLPEGYGFVWYPERRLCHACGWSPTLPFFQDFARPGRYDDWHFLTYLDMLSRFPVAHTTDWFLAGLDRLEQHRTDRGTYLLPEKYLHQKYFERAFLSETDQALKRGEKKILVNEIVSTLFVLKIRRAGGPG
jgi:hypothetical protein